jgi:hypothetical protein
MHLALSGPAPAIPDNFPENIWPLRYVIINIRRPNLLSASSVLFQGCMSAQGQPRAGSLSFGALPALIQALSVKEKVLGLVCSKRFLQGGAYSQKPFSTCNCAHICLHIKKILKERKGKAAQKRKLIQYRHFPSVLY